MQYKYRSLKYVIRILNDGNSSYSMKVPLLPGFHSAGKDKEDCISTTVEAIQLHLGGTKRKPEPDSIPAIEVVETEPTADDYLISLPKACKLAAYNFGKEYKFKISGLSDFIDSTRDKAKADTRKTA